MKNTVVLQLQGRYEYDANPIGQGQYAVVYKGKSVTGAEDVAVKLNYLGKLKPKELMYLNSVCFLFEPFRFAKVEGNPNSAIPV
jgi:hypothetical protein